METMTTVQVSTSAAEYNGTVLSQDDNEIRFQFASSAEAMMWMNRPEFSNRTQFVPMSKGHRDRRILVRYMK